MIHITRDFFSFRERYFWDFGHCSHRLGWAQLDTDADAPYLGAWAKPSVLTIVSFCEGDLTITRCETVAEFVAELRSFEEMGKRSEYGFRIDSMCDPEIHSAFERMGLGDLLPSPSGVGA